jgi:hypothetical protein
MVSAFIRLSILGTAPGGEVWSINPTFNLLADEVVTYADAAAIATAVNALTVPNQLRGLMATSSAVSGCRVEARRLDGSLESQAQSNRATPSPGLGSQVHPPQSSLVFSLRSGFPGASGRGRCYWPATGVTMTGTTLRVDPTSMAGTLSAFVTYMGDLKGAINSVLGSTCVLSVWSRKTSELYAINRVILGDVVDTQRRRRDNLPESYLSADLPI